MNNPLAYTDPTGYATQNTGTLNINGGFGQFDYSILYDLQASLELLFQNLLFAQQPSGPAAPEKAPAAPEKAPAPCPKTGPNQCVDEIKVRPPLTTRIFFRIYRTAIDYVFTPGGGGGNGGKHRYGSKVFTSCKDSDAFDAVKDMSAPGTPRAVEGTRRLDASPLIPFGQGVLPDYFTHKNPIRQVVSTPNQMLVNTALEGHVFFPGDVVTTVTPTATGSVITTVGTGTGGYPSFNNLVGTIYFGFRNYSIKIGCDAANGIPNND